MLSRHAIRALGLSARPLLNPPTRTAAPRFLKAALTPRLQPTRLLSSTPGIQDIQDASALRAGGAEELSSPETAPTTPATDATLTPPWQVSDLAAFEQAAYEKYGPGYVEHLDPKEKSLALRNARNRASAARYAERELGPDWYSVLKEADGRFRAEYEIPIQAEFERRKNLIGPIVDYTKPPTEYRQLQDDIRAWSRGKDEKKRELRRQLVKERVPSASPSPDGQVAE